MHRDDFTALLERQLDALGAAVLLQHHRVTEALRLELDEARGRLEEKDPAAWQVPEEPTPRWAAQPHQRPALASDSWSREPPRPEEQDKLLSPLAGRVNPWHTPLPRLEEQAEYDESVQPLLDVAESGAADVATNHGQGFMTRRSGTVASLDMETIEASGAQAVQAQSEQSQDSVSPAFEQSTSGRIRERMHVPDSAQGGTPPSVDTPDNQQVVAGNCVRRSGLTFCDATPTAMDRRRSDGSMLPETPARGSSAYLGLEDRHRADFQRHQALWRYSPEDHMLHLRQQPDDQSQQLATTSDVQEQPTAYRSEESFRQPPSTIACTAGAIRLRFVAREVWNKSYSTPTRKQVFMRSSVDVMTPQATDKTVGGAHWRRLMLRPTDRTRLCWSVCCFLFLCYDIVFVPLDVIFALPQSLWILWTELASAVFWTCDIFVNFITGVDDPREGSLEMRPWPVAMAYLKGFFSLDVTLVFCEWVSLVVQPDGGLQALAVARTMRLFRILRLMRVTRFSRVFNEIMLLLPERSLLACMFMKSVFLFAALLHGLACIWYAVAEKEVVLGAYDGSVKDYEPVSLKYVYAVRWSVAQLHGISVAPLRTTGEMLLAAFTGLLGLVVIAVCVTKTADALESTEDKRKQKMLALSRQYLRSHNVSAELRKRLRKHLDNEAAHLLGRFDMFPRTFASMNLREKVQHEEAMVKELPFFLQAYLFEEARRPLLETQQLFQDLGIAGKCTAVMRELCHRATTPQVALANEFVFGMGEVCKQSYIIATGKLVYLHGVLPEEVKCIGSTALTLEAGHGIDLEDDDDSNGEVVEITVEREMHVSEAALWTKWEHCGLLVARRNCTMLTMDATLFAKVICNHDSMRSRARRYAACVLAWMNTLSDAEAYSDLLAMPSNIADAQIQTHQWNATDHLIFISHYKKEAGTEATLLEEGFERLIHGDPMHPANDFRRPVFLDSQDLVNLKSLERYVRRSHNLVLLLTPEVLTRPWCLLEIMTALEHRVEIVPVVVKRPDLSFEFPGDEFFHRLAEGKVLNTQDEDLLKQRGIALLELKKIKQVFDKIALPFSPHGSVKIRDAELEDILKRCNVRQKLPDVRRNHVGERVSAGSDGSVETSFSLRGKTKNRALTL